MGLDLPKMGGGGQNQNIMNWTSVSDQNINLQPILTFIPSFILVSQFADNLCLATGLQLNPVIVVGPAFLIINLVENKEKIRFFYRKTMQ